MTEARDYVRSFAVAFEKRYGFPWNDSSHPTPPDYEEWVGGMWEDEMRRRGIKA